MTEWRTKQQLDDDELEDLRRWWAADSEPAPHRYPWTAWDYFICAFLGIIIAGAVYAFGELWR